MTAIGSNMKHLRSIVTTAFLLSPMVLVGCQGINQTIYNGFVADKETLALAPVGSSREQVLLSLGSPSATATFDNEVFYYISQKRTRPVAFMKPRIVSQSVLTIYFNNKGRVDKIANYSLKDGKVFDMISRTTPTGGKEVSFLQQLLAGGTSAQSIGRSFLGGQ